jgi:hypothetical protein
LLPKEVIQDYPLFRLKDAIYPEEQYDSLYMKTLKHETQYDNRLLLDEPARPEAEGYGYMSGTYVVPRPGSRIGGIQHPSTRCTLGLGRAIACSCPGASSHPPFPVHPPTPPPHHKPIFKPVYTVNATLPTLLGSGTNHTLNVYVAQFRSILPHGYITKVFVNGQWVVAPDVPTRNGAIHVVKRLIKPRGHGKHGHGGHGHHTEGPVWADATLERKFDDDWNDWEEWLPQWVNED